jgi:hypothetical protein
VSPSSPTVLAAGRVTRNDSLTVELHQPPGSPAFILLRWPQAESVVEPNPSGLAGVASLVVRVLAEAQAQLAAIRASEP